MFRVQVVLAEGTLAGPRALLTERAVRWVADALQDDDTTVDALDRRLKVDWHTLWDALKVEARRRGDDPDRRQGVEALGVDEHVWRPGWFGAGREDLQRRPVPGRERAGWCAPSRPAARPVRARPARWLDARTPQFRAQIKHAALDPFREYANALRDWLSDAVQVLDAFHVVKLGTQVVDERHRQPS